MIAPAKLGKKHLTENQMLGCRQAPRSEPATQIFPIYISWYINDYGRPRTSLDVISKIMHVHRQIAGPHRVLLPTTDQKSTREMRPLN
jgi:hypothetical protein